MLPFAIDLSPSGHSSPLSSGEGHTSLQRIVFLTAPYRLHPNILRKPSTEIRFKTGLAKPGPAANCSRRRAGRTVIEDANFAMDGTSEPCRRLRPRGTLSRIESTRSLWLALRWTNQPGATRYSTRNRLRSSALVRQSEFHPFLRTKIENPSNMCRKRIRDPRRSGQHRIT